MDPLTALRDFTMRNELDKIVLSGDGKLLHFAGEYSFPAAAPTAYRSKQGTLYTLETLVFFVRHHNLKHTDYLQSCRLHRLPAVTLPDRKPLLDYLFGLTSSAAAIELLPPTAAAAAADVSVTEEYRPEDPALVEPSAADVSNQMDPLVSAPDRVVDYVSMIRSLERPLKDRETLMECKNRDFYTVLVQSTKREEERQRIESQQRKDGLVAKSRLIGSDASGIDVIEKPKIHLKGSKVGEGVPIILVPSASQTLITIYNVKEFLEDGVFVPSDTKMKGMKVGTTKPDCVTVQKKLSRDRAVAAYEVRDKTVGFKPEDWDRVVAVFVLGKEWQFKDWPFKDHVEIFNKSE